jgi:hypothetical protein
MRRRAWHRGRHEIALLVFAYLTYFGVRGVTEGSVPRAVSNALGFMHLERLLGIDIERPVQALVDQSRALVDIANAVYIWGYLPALIVGGVVLFRLAPSHYYRLRNVCLVSGALGLIVFALFPVAPPRLAPSGLEDTITEYATTYRRLLAPSLVNEYAAIPSFHVGWILMLGIEMFRATRRVLVRALGVALPCAMAFSVVATANHYVLDVLAGVAAVGVALLIVTLREHTGPARIRHELHHA